MRQRKTVSIVTENALNGANGVVKIPYRGYRISITTKTRVPELRVFYGDSDVTANLSNGRDGMIGSAESIRYIMNVIDAFEGHKMY